MRFFENGPSIPNHLLEQSDSGRVVFFCGAGVSQYGINSEINMPSFLELTRQVVDYFKPSKESDISKALMTWDEGANYRPVPLDEIFFFLQSTFCKEEVNQVVANILSIKNTSMTTPTRHQHISQISKSKEGLPQIVTTNFDTLFEKAIQDPNLKYHFPPFLPDLSQGTPITGVTYLHGRLSESSYNIPQKVDHLNELVLSSSDLGRAYLSEGWATDFVRHLVSEYTVVLIGYKADDPPIHYLLLGMGSGNSTRRSNLYAFDHGEPNDLESKWRAKGVTPIGYSCYHTLWKTIEMWAGRSNDTSKWRNKTIKLASQDPKSIKPHERGQIVYLMSTVDGSKKFSELMPAAHPEWINVLDDKIRIKKRWKLNNFDEAEIISKSPYLLDDDSPDDEQAKLVSSSSELLALNDMKRNTLSMSISKDRHIRHQYLIDWICKNFNSTVMLWWIARQNNLSLSTIRYLKIYLQKDKEVNAKARSMWNFVIEFQTKVASRPYGSLWDFLTQIKDDGWNESTVRELSRLTAPRITRAPDTDRQMQPPVSNNWNTTSLQDIAVFSVKFANLDRESIEVPDEYLLPTLRAFQENLIRASYVISEIDTLNGSERRLTPTTYQDRETSGNISNKRFTSEVVRFLDLFARLVAIDAIAAKNFAQGWPKEDHYFFRKFRLHALNHEALFNIQEIYEFIMNLSDEEFWCDNNNRELLFLVADNKDRFTQRQRNLIINRILTIPTDSNIFGDQQEDSDFAEYLSIVYSLYLVNQGFKISKKHQKHLGISAKEYGDWSDAEFNYIVNESGTEHRSFSIDYSTDVLKNVKDKDLIEVLDRETKKGIGLHSVLKKDPFSGLAQKDPKKALSALAEKEKNKEYPVKYWQKFLHHAPSSIEKEVYIKIMTIFINSPSEFLTELGDSLHKYMKEKFYYMVNIDSNTAWKLFDEYFSSWMNYSEAQSVTNIGIYEDSSSGGGKRTFYYAAGQPVGKITKCLLNCIDENAASLPDNIRLKFEEIMTKSGEFRHNCIAMLASRLDLLYRVDADWTRRQLFPHFDLNRDTSEAAWSGMLASRGHYVEDIILSHIYSVMKLFPWVNNDLSWRQEDINKCAHLVIDTGLKYSKEFHLDFNEKVRDCIREMNEEARYESISVLHNIGKRHGEWLTTVVPFLDNVWPKESLLRTQKLTSYWLSLLADTNESFSDVYSSVSNFLTPLEYPTREFDAFFIDRDGNGSLATTYPLETLDVLDRVIPSKVDYLYIDLSKMLSDISSADASISNDPRYIRLFDLSERSPVRPIPYRMRRKGSGRIN